MKSRSPKTVFICQQCGAESLRWAGRCNDCGEWNSLVEQVRAAPEPARAPVAAPAGNRPVAISRIATERFQRIDTGAAELNRVLGGGIVPGSLMLIGGDPGIGKSTLLLQVAHMLAGSAGTVLYVSGEESTQQIKLRADRLGISSDHLLLLSETSLDIILAHVREVQPSILIVDSIQTVFLEDLTSAAGSVSQVRECTSQLQRIAKASSIPTFIVGHVTKEGAIAGPRVLEHIVDVVLYLEGERFHSFRLLRGVKNRFGSTNEVGVFEMSDSGLVEVQNPSQAFLAERHEAAPGNVVTVTMEGTRPLLVEIQALATYSPFGIPRRTANGLDQSRLLLMSAVLTKQVGLALSNQDLFVNVVGGLKIGEPAADLATAVAIGSSFRDNPVQPDTVVLGEIGLTGEVRAISHLDRRLSEAAKIGFRRAIVPASGGLSRVRGLGVEITPVRTVREALDAAVS